MPQAVIQINAVTGSNDDLPINTLVQLNNLNSGGELSYQWSIVWQPDGPIDALSSTTIQSPTFTPTKEGTYLIRLVVNFGLVSEQVDQVIAAVRQVKTRLRVPAVGETDENGSYGWGDPTAANNFLQLVDAMNADPGLHVCVVNGLGVVIGSVVKYNGPVTIKAGLPGQEDLLGVELASAATPTTEPLGYVVASVDGSPLGPGVLAVVRRFGLQQTLAPFPAPVPGQPAYLDDFGNVATVPGTTTRVVGVWIATGLADYLYFDGAQQTGSGAAVPGIKYWLESTDSIVVPNRYQYLIKAPLIVDPGGSLTADPGGQIVILP